MTHYKDFNFDVIKENWNTYRLSDGTTLKIKIVLMRIVQEGLDPLGNPVTGTVFNTIVAPIPPDNLRHLKKIDPIFDLNVETIEENWNEYNSDDGFIVKIKPNISQIDRLDKVDPRGDPLYRLSMQPSIKRIPKKGK